jgi:hypothetical protein
LFSTLALAWFAQGTLAADSDWLCSTLAGNTTSPLAQSASGFLARAGQIYPSQLLGMVRASERIYLVNARDEGWSERVRQGLMELRLAEPDITAARRFHGAVSGAADVEIPAGEFVCLARARAGRHGLTLTGGGAMLLAPGRSVHLVDPYEPSIVVEVKAVGNEPLDFREILALSGRSGIYAGLAGKRAQPGASAAARRLDEAIVVALGPGGRLGELVITPRARDGDGKVEEKPAVTIVAAAPVVAPAPALPAVEAPPARVAQPETRADPAPAPPVAEVPPDRVVQADVPADPPLAKPVPPEAPAPVVVAVAEPVSVAAPVRAAARQAAGPLTGQSYEEYARTMRSLMALRRSGGVRSISELTYVHPAVEDLRAHR